MMEAHAFERDGEDMTVTNSYAPASPRSPRAPVAVSASAASSVRGSGRETNEDSFLVAGPLLAVADGVGGAAAGERASRLVVDTLRRLVPEDPADPEAALAAAVEQANRAVRAAAVDGAAGMGSTVVAALIGAGGVTVANAGDSRAYLWHDDALRRLTADDSIAADLAASGKISAADARRSPLRSILLRAVGVAEELEVRPERHHASPGDVLLLCSDGLWDGVDDETLALELAAGQPLPELAARLVALARAHGSHDDITIACALIG